MKRKITFLTLTTLSVITLASCDFSSSKNKEATTMTKFSPDMVDFDAIDPSWMEPFISEILETMDPSWIYTIPAGYTVLSSDFTGIPTGTNSIPIPAYAEYYGYKPSSISSFDEFMTYMPASFNEEIKSNIRNVFGNYVESKYAFFENEAQQQYICYISYGTSGLYIKSNNGSAQTIEFFTESVEKSPLYTSRIVPIISSSTFLNPFVASTLSSWNYSSTKLTNLKLLDNYRYSFEMNGNYYKNDTINQVCDRDTMEEQINSAMISKYGYVKTYQSYYGNYTPYDFDISNNAYIIIYTIGETYQCTYS